MPKCKRYDCIYHARAGMAWGCDYSEIAGRCKLKQVKEYKTSECPFYEPGTREERARAYDQRRRGYGVCFEKDGVRVHGKEDT